jgi:hypothetical protein
MGPGSRFAWPGRRLISPLRAQFRSIECFLKLMEGGTPMDAARFISASHQHRIAILRYIY